MVHGFIQGDHGIYDFRFAWDPARGASRATDSRGGVTDYVHHLFRRADEALYAAKAAGRDGVHADLPRGAGA